MKKIYDIGHSRRSIEEFLEILESVNFDLLVDVRTRPFSRWTPQFNRPKLQALLGSKYLFMGDFLGGLDKTLSENKFNLGIEKVCKMAEKKILVLTCTEKQPEKCHRSKRIAPKLELRGFEVIHL